MSRDDRRTGRRAAFENDRADRDAGESGFLKKGRVTKPDDELAKMGVCEYRPESGEKGEAMNHAIHLLPVHPDDAKANMDVIALPLYYHWSVGVNKEDVICPRMQAQYFRSKRMPVPPEIQDGRCAICEKLDGLIESYRKNKSSLSEEDQKARWEEIKALHPYSGSYKNPRPKRYFAWVVDAVSESTEDEGVKFWMMPTSVYEEGVIELSEDDNGEFRDLADPESGFIFRFKKSGQKRDTTYTGYRVRRRDYSVADWAKSVPRLFEVLNFKTADEICDIMSAAPAEADEKPADEDRPRRRPAAEASREEVGDELEEEFQRDRKRPADSPRRAEQDDDGDDEPPRRQRRRTEEPKDEPEREEPPRRQRRRSEETDDGDADLPPADGDEDTNEELKEIRRRRQQRLAEQGEK